MKIITAKLGTAYFIVNYPHTEYCLANVKKFVQQG